PTGLLQLGCDAAGERRGLRGSRSRGRADNEVGPGVGAVAVDRGDLPDGAAAAVQASDEEAVEADQLARPLRLDVRLRLRLARRLEGRAVAGDQRQPLRPRVEAVADERLVDAIGRHDQSAPLGPGELSSDPLRTESGLAERE